jgi:3-keto-5-aminohexanoate cleavage enzyme
MAPNKCIITVAPTGGLTQKAQQPNLPVGPDEIISDILECEKEGASLAHLHTRDDKGQHTLDVNKFKEILSGIREKSEIITCVSTTNWKVTNSSMKNKFHLLSLKPDYFSFHVNSFNRGEELFLNDPGAVRELLTEAKIQQVKPEFEMFDLGAIYKAQQLISEFDFPEGQRFQFIFGVNGGVRDFNSRILHTFIEAVGNRHHWGAGAVGRHQLPANLMAMMEGGDVRTGFEDNINIRKGELAGSNSQLVRRLVDYARDLNVSIATVREAREKLNCLQQIA